jgi:hypothetical protein
MRYALCPGALRSYIKGGDKIDENKNHHIYVRI